MNNSIIDVLKSLGMTQQELAYKLGVSTSTITKWYAGNHKPSPMAMEKIHKFLKIKA